MPWGAGGAAPRVSLSARRAWIEIVGASEGADSGHKSLSARRAWIEIREQFKYVVQCRVALRKESVDRNATSLLVYLALIRRSPQGERG